MHAGVNMVELPGAYHHRSLCEVKFCDSFDLPIWRNKQNVKVIRCGIGKAPNRSIGPKRTCFCPEHIWGLPISVESKDSKLPFSINIGCTSRPRVLVCNSATGS